MRSTFPTLIEGELNKKRKIFVLLGDIGVFSFRNIFKKFPNNIENFGVMEQSMISIAAGLSIGGHIPIVHTIAPFLIERAYEQLKIDFGYQKLRGNFISVGGSFDYSGLGATHHCPSDINTIKNIPNFQILIPGHPKEFKKLFKSTYNNNFPTYTRLSETPNSFNINVEFGKAKLIKKNTKDLLVIVFGDMLEDTIKATSDLPITILYYTTLEPFDTYALKKYFKKKILIISQFYSGSVENDVLNSLGDRSIVLKSLSIPKKFIHKYGSKKEIKKYLNIDQTSIRKNVINLLK